MARRKAKSTVSRLPEAWLVEYDIHLGRRHLTPGTEVKIQGERGRYRFIKRVTTPTAQWLDFVGGPAGHASWRSFGEERVKTVHRIQTTRANNKPSS